VLLRASGEISGNELDVAAVTDDAAAAGSGIAHAETLLAFADAAVEGSDAALDPARGRLLEALGPECLVDAAAVVGNFERMVRIADSTGIPLDAPVTAMSEDLRADLGLNDFHSSANTPRMGPLGLFLGRNLRSLSRIAFRLLGTRARRL
jgi:hypothetical protein